MQTFQWMAEDFETWDPIEAMDLPFVAPQGTDEIVDMLQLDVPGGIS